MTAEQTALLVGALVGLFGAIQAWLVSRTLQHGNSLNGDMDRRIQQGAKAAVANDHALRGEQPSPATNAATAARIAALRSELETLEAVPAAVIVPPLLPPRRR
jgi:hypothetical protein